MTPTLQADFAFDSLPGKIGAGIEFAADGLIGMIAGRDFAGIKLIVAGDPLQIG